MRKSRNPERSAAERKSTENPQRKSQVIYAVRVSAGSGSRWQERQVQAEKRAPPKKRRQRKVRSEQAAGTPENAEKILQVSSSMQSVKRQEIYGAEAGEKRAGERGERKREREEKTGRLQV